MEALISPADHPDQLGLLLAEAASALLPPHLAAAAALPKERVRRCQGFPATRGADLISHLPVTLHRHLVLAAAATQLAAEADGPGVQLLADGSLTVRVVSASGVQRTTQVLSPADLAETLLAEIPPARLGSLVADARATPRGELLMLTWSRLAAGRAAGQLLCSACGRFFPDGRGLRDHVQVAHAAGFEGALAVVCAARRSIVPRAAAFAPPCAPCVVPPPGLAAAREPRSNRGFVFPPGLAAARDGDMPALAAAVAGGWDPAGPDAADAHGSGPLLWAAGGGHLEAVRFLVERCCVNPRSSQPRDGRNALHWCVRACGGPLQCRLCYIVFFCPGRAARNGRTNVVEWLVRSCGLSADEGTRDGTRPLHWAIWQGQLATAGYLVDGCGADLHAQNSYGCNAAQAGRSFLLQPKSTKLLCRRSLKQLSAPLQWAAMRPQPDACAWLHSRGLAMGLLNCNGHSCLHKAAQAGATEAAHWLVQVPGLGAAHWQPDRDGNTPAEMARLCGHADLAAWLRNLQEGHDAGHTMYQ